jgi:hypothetical protein
VTPCYAVVCFILQSHIRALRTILLPQSPNFGPIDRPLHHTNSPHMNHNNTTTPIIMPASLRMATLFPDAAILPSRPADPFKEVPMEEKVSDYGMRHQL